ncbi:MAG: NADH-quinone oxidoreductase subunit H [Acidimicrobiaceae bacterium]|jgi:formate hydrogenlyase subunit 4|nr:NADH-quinone oxidoreductase subunit H [Acidimicrobiaceae bacterium]MBK9969957.1 NADH-quinone oxidoreductase subunit H [Acidimicrobiaceae bacterium]
MSPTGIAVAVLQVILTIAVAPLLVGMMRVIRARLEGRVGAPIRQPWRDLRKLLRKQRMVSQNTGVVFSIAPLVLLASAALVAGIVPFLSTTSALDQVGDLFAIVYLLLLGTVFLSLAGLDAGTAFGGMGSSREMTIAAIAEPTLLVAIFALSVSTGSSNLGAIVADTLANPSKAASPASMLAFSALAVVTIAETGRIPVDNPSTHLELTMIHEAMILEYSGPDLALVELAAHLRLVVFLGLLANLFFPWGIATTAQPLHLLAAAGAVTVKLIVLAAVIAAAEVFIAKVRLFRVPELLAASFVLAFLAVTVSFFLV